MNSAVVDETQSEQAGGGPKMKDFLGHGLTILAIVIAGIASYGTFQASSAVTNAKVDGLVMAQSKTDAKVDTIAIEQAKAGEQIKALTARVDELANRSRNP